MLHHDESNEHLVRRLEAFSDIVIGFSLAELSLSLTLHGRFSEVLHDSSLAFVGYVWTFFVVCQLWYMHHRLFARAFIPGRLAIFLNFVWLGTIGLIAYLLQVYLHFAADPVASRLVFEAYFCLYGINLAILVWLYRLGASAHEGRLDISAVQSIHATVLRLGVAASVVLVLVASGPFLSLVWFYPVVGPSIFFGFVIAGIVMRVASRTTHR